MEILKKVLKFFEALGAENLQVLLEENNLEKVKEFCETLIVKKVVVDTYAAVVDYTMSLADMIKVGKYDWVNDDITAEHFPVTGSGKTEVNLEFVHLNKSVSSEAVLAHMEANGLRPATLAELLSFGAKYPEIQREFPIVALGSSWIVSVGNRFVPYLFGSSSDRHLNLSWFGSGWVGYFRFLAVRKSL
jgi:hypothetical protein